MIASVARHAAALAVVLTFAPTAAARPAGPGGAPDPAPPSPPGADAPAAPDGAQAPTTDGPSDPDTPPPPAPPPAEADTTSPTSGAASTPPAAAPGTEPPPPTPPPSGSSAKPPWPPYGYGQAPSAAPPGQPPADDEPRSPAPRDVPHRLGAELGVRTVFIMDDGFEPYRSDGDSRLTQLVVAGTIVPLRFEPFSLALVPEYNFGEVEEQTRGQAFSLAVHRLAVGVQADFAIIRHLHAYARVAPGALYLHGSIADAAVEQSLVADEWTWTVDATAGLAVLFGTVGDRADPTVGFWFLGEWGYSFAGEADMPYSPEEDDEDPRRFGEVNLPPVSPGGIVNRLSLGLTF